MTIRAWKRKDTGNADYNSDKHKVSNKHSKSDDVVPVQYVRKFEWDKEALRNQNKSEGKDIPKPKWVKGS